MDILRLMAEPSIDFENPFETGGQSFAISAHVSINNTAIVGRPHDSQPGLFHRELAEQIQFAVLASIVEDRNEHDVPQGGAFLEHAIDKSSRLFNVISHRTNDSQA